MSISYQESVIRWADPSKLVAALDKVPTSGQEYLDLIVDGTLPSAPAIAATGAELIDVKSGRSTMTFTPSLIHCNAMRQVHGGVISTLLDTAIGYAVISLLPFGQGFSTLQLNINFLRGVGPGSGNAIVEGKVVRNGRRVIAAIAELKSFDGKLSATASANCLTLQPK